MLKILPQFIGDLWTNRTLLNQFVSRNLKLRHRGSYLGVAWSILNPLLLLCLYLLVFGYIFGGSFGVIPNETPLDYGLGIFMGLSVFHFVSESAAASVHAITNNPSFVKKIVFPLPILPAAEVGTALIHMLVSIILVLLGALLTENRPTFLTLWLPIILCPLVFLQLEVGWILAAIGVFVRDLSQMIQFVTMALLFSSAVFYPAAKIPGPAWEILKYNPYLVTVELSRNTALWNIPPDWSQIAYLYGIGFGVCVLGYWTFSRLKSAFAEVL